jgi:hypothetical protein
MFGSVLVNNSLTISAIGFLSRQRVGHLDNDLPLALRTEALFTGVLVLHAEDMPMRAFDFNSHDQSLSSDSSNSANSGDDSQTNHLLKASGLEQPARRHFWVPQNSVAEVSMINSIGSGKSQRKFLPIDAEEAHQPDRSISIKPAMRVRASTRLKVLPSIRQ